MTDYLALFQSADAAPEGCAKSARSGKSHRHRVPEAPFGPSGPFGTPLEAGNDDAAERAALIQYGAGVPSEWAEGYARLLTLPRPNSYSDAAWQTLIDDGGRFLDAWARQAAALGWDAADLFGVHPKAPAARPDCMGLVPLIGGGAVVAITEATARIRFPTGSEQTYYRRPPAAGIPVWTLEDEHNAA